MQLAIGRRNLPWTKTKDSASGAAQVFFSVFSSVLCKRLRIWLGSTPEEVKVSSGTCLLALLLEEATTRVAIIGTGAYAQALGARFASVGVEVVYGSRSADRQDYTSSRCPPTLNGRPVVSPCEAVSAADVVVFAIPIAAHSAMAECLRRVISGRRIVIIDVSNSPLGSADTCVKRWFARRRRIKLEPRPSVDAEPGVDAYSAIPPSSNKQSSCGTCSDCHSSSSSPCHGSHAIDIEDLADPDRTYLNRGKDIEIGAGVVVEEDEDEEGHANLSNAERLQRLIPTADVVKAFNTVSAYTLKCGIGARLDDRVLICGDRADAKNLVSRLVHAIGMRPVDAGPLAAAREIERRPLQQTEWRTAFWMSIVLLIACYAFVAIRDVWLAAQPGQSPQWSDLLLLKFNVVIAWHAITLLSLTFGAGVMAAIRQLVTGTMKRAFPLWLDAWLRARKALGLLGVGSAGLHVVAALVSNSLFIDWQYIESREGTEFQGSMLAGLLAGGVYTALAITSLPSVSASLSWREWDFMQSKLGHVGLALATIHVLLMSFALGDLPDASAWADRHWLPPVSVLAMTPALLVLVLRLIIVLPPLSGRLARIRGASAPDTVGARVRKRATNDEAASLTPPIN